MKYSVALLLFFLILAQAHSQVSSPLTLEEQNSLIHKVSAIKDADEKLKAIDDLMHSGKLTTNGQIASLYSGRAETLWEVYLKHMGDEGIDEIGVKQQAIDSVLVYYKKAIDACVFCQPTYKADRAEFLKNQELANTNPLYLEDMKCAKDHGFKETEQGFTLGLNYMGGKSDFAGFMVSPWGQVIPRYKVMNTDPEDGKLKVIDENRLPYSMNILAFEYNRNLDQPTSREFTFSLFQMTSPLLINFTKFGFTQSFTLPIPSWFYRPEIGIGWSFISVGYAYNFVFSKSDRSQLNSHMFLLRLCYPIVMYNKG
jgi:hypothetical protein